jgi:hypothetical protein
MSTVLIKSDCMRQKLSDSDATGNITVDVVLLEVAISVDTGVSYVQVN